MRIILDELITQIEGKIPDVGKQNLVTQRPDPLKITSFPTVAIYDTDLIFDKVGLGEGYGTAKEETEEEFSGDGTTKVFKLKSGPIRPLILVQSPIGYTLREGHDFTVEYLKGQIAFKSAPEKAQKGKNNTLVRYAVAKSAGEIKGIRIKLVCNFDIWGKNSIQCDSVTLEVIKSMLFAEEELATKRIHLTPLRGTNLSLMASDAKDKDDKRKDLSGRRLVYVAETDLKFDIHVPVIQKIEVAEKEIDKMIPHPSVSP